MNRLSQSNRRDLLTALIIGVVLLLPMVGAAIYYKTDRGYVVVPGWWKGQIQ